MENKFNCLGSYSGFLRKFLDRGYHFSKFTDPIRPDGQLILRHDIDFDVELAHKAACVEKELGIQSTFFFLLRCEFYNPFSGENFRLINEIAEMGHSISIHFDPLLYADFNVGFQDELNYFRDVFKTPIDIISLHRPNEFFQKLNQPVGGVLHTYQEQFFKTIKYFADSTGVWRFGDPTTSEEFNQRKTIHLLIHPVWWFVPGIDNLEVLKNFYLSKVTKVKQDLFNNSIPFRQIIDELK